MKAPFNKTIPHHIRIELSGGEIADLFWELGATEQAEFFNRLGLIVGLSLQLEYITDSKALNHYGRCAMSKIGEHSTPEPK